MFNIILGTIGLGALASLPLAISERDKLWIACCLLSPVCAGLMIALNR